MRTGHLLRRFTAGKQKFKKIQGEKEEKEGKRREKARIKRGTQENENENRMLSLW